MIGAALLRSAEIATARILPGALNLLAIILTAQALSPIEYGRFSIVLATVVSLSSILFGPILQAIVPYHASYVADGRKQELERGVLGLSLLLSLVTLSIGAVAAVVGWITWASVVLLTAYSLFSAWQPVLRARLQFWRYGFSALAQGGMLLVLVCIWIEGAGAAETAIEAYAASYLFGFLLAWLLTGAPLPGALHMTEIRSLFGVGTSLALSTLAESFFLLGTRYAILWLGSPQFLGIFSFAIDLAQRSVGVVINIATFALVPRAYRASAEGGEGVAAFRAILVRGAVVSISVSALVLSIILLVDVLGLMERFVSGPFSVVAFCSVSIAIVVNRVKKLVLDPLAVVARRQWAIPLAYAILSPPALAVSLAVCYMGQDRMILIIYPLAYLATTIMTALLIRRGNRTPFSKPDGTGLE